jgi:beta-fructofuranosidase
MAFDPQKPHYHFLPPNGWMNDPNGLIQHKGVYHMFYQHNPNEARWGQIHWGHAASRDLVHWEHLPPALAPGPEPVDAGGIFSGCCVIHRGVPTIIYTGAAHPDYHLQLPCVALGDADLLNWHKYARNPVIAQRPPGTEWLGFRDHTVWQEDDEWHMLIGSGIRGVGGAVLHYVSPDLLNWNYRGPLLTGDRRINDSMWECPDFFRAPRTHDVQNDRVIHALVLAPIPSRRPIYCTGQNNDGKFTPQVWGRIDHGQGFAAPQSFTDEQGRRIMFGWLREFRPEVEQRISTWAGVMSLPRLVSLGEDSTLRWTPAPELERLRLRAESWMDMTINDGEPLVLPVRGDALELDLEFEPGDAWQCGLAVRQSPDEVEQTRIYFDNIHQCLQVDTRHSRLGGYAKLPDGAVFDHVPGDRLRLRVFVDASVIEVFADNRVCFTERIYPIRDDSLGVSLFSNGANARVAHCCIWQMSPIW